MTGPRRLHKLRIMTSDDDLFSDGTLTRVRWNGTTVKFMGVDWWLLRGSYKGTSCVYLDCTGFLRRC